MQTECIICFTKNCLINELTVSISFRYREKVKELSSIYHHRPSSPGAELVHWTEHVIMTGGTQHRRSPGFLVPWYQKLYLDLLACIVVGLIVIAIAVKKSILESNTWWSETKTK